MRHTLSTCVTHVDNMHTRVYHEILLLYIEDMPGIFFSYAIISVSRHNRDDGDDDGDDDDDESIPCYWNYGADTNKKEYYNSDSKLMLTVYL